MNRVLPMAGCLAAVAILTGCHLRGPTAPLSHRAEMPLSAIRPFPAPPGSIDLRPPEDEQAAALLEQSRRQAALGRHAEAIGLLEQALRRAPSSMVVQRELGLAHVAMGDYDAAREFLRAVDGDDVRIQHALGRIARQAGDMEHAALRFRTALLCTESDEVDAVTADEARLLLSGVLVDLGYLTAALDVLGELEQHLYLRDYDKVGGTLGALAEHPELLSIRQARILLELARYDEAFDAADAAFRMNKSYPPGCLLLAEALARAQRFDRADSVGLEILGAAIEPETTLRVLRTIYSAAEDPAGPSRLLADYEARQGVPPTATLLVVALATRTLGDPDAAQAILAAHLDAVDRPVPVALTLGDWLIADGRTEQALEVFSWLLLRDDRAYRRIRSRIHWTPQHYLDGDRVASLAEAAAVDSSPANYLRLYLTGILLRRMGQTGPAADQFARAIDARATYAPAYEALAEVHSEERRFDEMLDLAARASRAGLTLTTDFIGGRAHLARGEIDQAVDALHRVTEADRTHASARVGLAQAYLRQGKLTAASQALQEAVRESRDMEALGLLSQLHLAQYQREVRLEDASAARRTLQDIRQTVRELIRQEPTDPRALWLLGRILLEHHHYAEAEAVVDRLMDLTADNVRTRLLKVRVDLRAPIEEVGPRRFEVAMGDLAVAAVAEPTDPTVYRLRGEVLTARRRYDEAADAFREALRLRPAQTDLTLMLAGALRRAGRPDEAAEVLAETAQTDPTARASYAVALVEAGRVEQAVAFLERQIDAGLAGPLEPMLLMYALVEADRAAEGLAAADKAITDAAKADQTGLLVRALKLGLLARADRHKAMIDEAARWFEAVSAAEWLGRVDAEPGVSDIIVVLAATDFTFEQRLRWSPVVRVATPIQLAAGWLLVAERDAEAVGLVRRHIDQLDPADEDQAALASTMRTDLMRQLLQSGRSDAARSLYPSLLADDEDNVALLSLAGAVYSKPSQRDQRRAADLYARALKLDSDDPQLKNNLGYLWADRGENLAEAQRLLHEAIEADRSSHILDSLAWVHYKKGRLRPALALLREAINSPDGDNAVIYDHTGDVYWRLGRIDDAITMWTEAADLANARVGVWGDLTDADTRRVLREAPAKIQAAIRGRRPDVAPLGPGVRP